MTKFAANLAKMLMKTVCHKGDSYTMMRKQLRAAEAISWNSYTLACVPVRHVVGKATQAGMIGLAHMAEDQAAYYQERQAAVKRAVDYAMRNRKTPRRSLTALQSLLDRMAERHRLQKRRGAVEPVPFLPQFGLAFAPVIQRPRFALT